MLKTAEVYDVTVTLNDGAKLDCTLLNKPDALTLAIVAQTQKASASLLEAVPFANNIAVPPATESPDESNIVIGGTVIGTVCVGTRLAYLVPPRRGRKPKSAATE